MAQYAGPILAAIPGLIAAIVAYLSKQAGKSRRATTCAEHEAEEALLNGIIERLDKKDSAEVRALKKKIRELEAQLAEKMQGKLEGI